MTSAEQRLNASRGRLSIAMAVLTAVGVISTLGPSDAVAAVTVFTDRAAWESAIGGQFFTETFDTDKANAPSIVFDSGVTSVGQFGTSRNEIVNGQYAGNLDTDSDLFGTDFFETITWTFPVPILGFAADWSSTTTGEVLEVRSDFGSPGSEFTVNFDDALRPPDFGDGFFSGNGFLGFVGTGLFSTVQFTSSDLIPTRAGQLDELFFADNLSFFPVPDPASAALVIFGLGTLSLSRRVAFTPDRLDRLNG